MKMSFHTCSHMKTNFPESHWHCLHSRLRSETFRWRKRLVVEQDWRSWVEKGWTLHWNCQYFDICRNLWSSARRWPGVVASCGWLKWPSQQKIPDLWYCYSWRGKEKERLKYARQGNLTNNVKCLDSFFFFIVNYKLHKNSKWKLLLYPNKVRY